MIATASEHDALNEQQRARAAAAYEAARHILEDDPLPESITALAHWIVTGQQPHIIRADQHQVDHAAHQLLSDPDAARWSPGR